MFPWQFRIAKVLGIPIKVDISLVVLLLMFVQDYGFLYGPIVAVGLLASIVVHELAHSLVAIHKGCRVREITLMFMGGAARMEKIPRRPLDEFFMAAAGPATSLLIGSIAIWAGGYLPLLRIFPFRINIVQWIGVTNIALCVFNLLPAFPMDGGRILRATLTPRLGRLRATGVAVTIGKSMAVIFGIYGFFPPRNWTLVVIAFFLYITAGNEYRLVQMEEMSRRFPGFSWSFMDDTMHESQNNEPHRERDEVVISPPPYRKGKSEKADLFTDDEEWD